MSPVGYKASGLASVASLVAALSGCGGLEGADQTEATQNPIYHGAIATDLASGNVMLQLDNDFICSGTIYSDYWVLTSAHCFKQWYGWPLDSNGDGQLSLSELAGRYTVTPGPNANNQAVSLPARSVLIHPQGTLGSSAGVDAAMIWIGDPGFYSSYLWPTAYSSGKLNIDPVPASSLVGMTVLASGYAWDGIEGTSDGVLRNAWKLVVRSSQGAYTGSLFNGAGTGCSGDSGGSDRRWTGAAWVVTGVHSTGDTSCSGVEDGSPGAELWRTWVDTKGNSCPERTRRGRCHF